MRPNLHCKQFFLILCIHYYYYIMVKWTQHAKTYIILHREPRAPSHKIQWIYSHCCLCLPYLSLPCQCLAHTTKHNTYHTFPYAPQAPCAMRVWEKTFFKKREKKIYKCDNKKNSARAHALFERHKYPLIEIRYIFVVFALKKKEREKKK